MLVIVMMLPFERIQYHRLHRCFIQNKIVYDSSGKFINLDNILDNYINMEVCFPQGESKIWGKVIGLCLDKDGKVIGSPNENPYMNTALYEVQFDDGWLFFFLNFSVS